MSAAKHMDGPWATWESRRMQEIGVTGPTAAAAMTATADIRDKGYAATAEVLTFKQKVAAIALGETQDEAFANARLIAAAPELLEACLKLAEWDKRDKDRAISFRESIDLCDEAFRLMNAAISKATGESA